MTINTTPVRSVGPARAGRTGPTDRTAALGVALRAVRFAADQTQSGAARSGLLAADRAVRAAAVRPRVWVSTDDDPGPDVTHISDGKIVYRRRTDDPGLWTIHGDAGTLFSWQTIPTTLRVDASHPCPPGCSVNPLVSGSANGLELSELRGRFVAPDGRSPKKKGLVA